MIKKYVKKPIPIEAIQWTGDNIDEILRFAQPNVTAFRPTNKNNDELPLQLRIHTLEGDMFAPINSYIIKGIRGEIYSCREDIFNETYEEYEE